jgi:hypothetical protein
MTQTLKEVRVDELKEGQDFILSYWRYRHTISTRVEFVDSDIYFIYFRASKSVAPNRDDTSYSKMAFKDIRALFIEEN